MFRTYIQSCSLVLTFEASWFFLVGNIGLDVRTIASLSATKWGYNLDAAKTLAKQNADYWIGFSLILLAFCLQLTNSFWEMPAGEFAVNKNALILALATGLLTFVLSHFLSAKISRSKFEAAALLLKKE